MVTRISALLGVIWMALAGAGCSARRGSENEDVAPDVRFEQVDFQVFRGPELTASGSAAVARLRRDTNELDVDSIQIKFPATPARQEARVTAARGNGNVAQRWFEVSGGVTAVQGDDTARTERARYSHEDGLVHGDAPVSVSGPAYQLTGPGFSLDPRGGTVLIEGGANIRAGAAR